MAMHYDLRKVRDLDKRDAAVTQTIIEATNLVMLNRIETKNVQEWLVRLRFLEGLGRGIHILEWVEGRETPRERPLTVHDVRPYCGLSTNATSLDRAQFMRRWMTAILRAAEAQVADEILHEYDGEAHIERVGGTRG